MDLAKSVFFPHTAAGNERLMPYDWHSSTFQFSAKLPKRGLNFNDSILSTTRISQKGASLVKASQHKSWEIDKGEQLMEDPYGHVEDVMSLHVVTTHANAPLRDVIPHFEHFTGLPVVDEHDHCIGLLSDKDVAKYGLAIGDVHGRYINGEVNAMTSPAVVIQHALIAYAAGLMLQHKVHRLPVVDREGRVVGIVSRTDIYYPLMPDVNPVLRKGQ